MCTLDTYCSMSTSVFKLVCTLDLSNVFGR